MVYLVVIDVFRWLYTHKWLRKSIILICFIKIIVNLSSTRSLCSTRFLRGKFFIPSAKNSSQSSNYFLEIWGDNNFISTWIDYNFTWDLIKWFIWSLSMFSGDYIQKWLRKSIILICFMKFIVILSSTRSLYSTRFLCGKFFIQKNAY